MLISLSLLIIRTAFAAHKMQIQPIFTHWNWLDKWN